MVPSVYDIAVIGAGMFGSAAAKYLSLEQANVALIGPAEPANKIIASSQLVFGAYYDQARITRRLGWDEVWSATDSRSLNRYRQIEQETGIDFFYECGSLVMMAKSITRRSDKMIRQCEADSIIVERMAAQSLTNKWPYLQVPPMAAGVEGLYESQLAGYINPRQMVKAQQTLFAEAGGTLLSGTVIGVKKNKSLGLWKLCVLSNKSVTEISAKKLLISAGAFINFNNLLPLAYQLAMDCFTELNLLFEITQQEIEAYQNMPTIITVDPADVGNKNMSIYLLPPIKYPDGKWYIRIGPGMQPIVQQLNTLEEIRQWYVNQKVTMQQKSFLVHMTKMLLPKLNYKSIKEACCVIEKTPTHHPYIGAIGGDDSINVVVGGNGHGARGSDEIGRLAANVMLHKEWDFPVQQDNFKPVLKLCNKNKERVQCKPPFGLC